MVKNDFNDKSCSSGVILSFKRILIVSCILLETVFSLSSAFLRSQTTTINLGLIQENYQQIFRYVDDIAGQTRSIYRYNNSISTQEYFILYTNSDRNTTRSSFVLDTSLNQLVFKAADPTLTCTVFYTKLDKNFVAYTNFYKDFQPKYLYPTNANLTYNDAVIIPSSKFSHYGQLCTANKIDKYVWVGGYKFKFETQTGEVDPFVDQNLQTYMTSKAIYEVNFQIIWNNENTIKYNLITSYSFNEDIETYSIKLKTYRVKNNLQRFILYGTRLNKINNYYQAIALIYIIDTSQVPVYVNRLGIFKGNFTQLPSFSISPGLTKVLIYGKDTLSLPFYTLISIDFHLMYSFNVNIPKQITTLQDILIKSSDNFLYMSFKSPSNYRKNTLYLINGKTLIKYFNQQLLQNETSIEQAIIIKQSIDTSQQESMLAVLTLFYRKQNVVSYFYIQIPSLSNLVGFHPDRQITYTQQHYQQAQFGIFNFTIPFDPSTTKARFFVLQGFFWDSYSRLILYQYDNINLYKTEPIYFDSDNSKKVSIIAFNKKQLNCFAAVNKWQPYTAFYIASFEYDFIKNISQSSKSVNYFDQIITPNSIDIGKASIQLSDGCKALKIDNYIFIRNASTLVYQKEMVASSWSKGYFDQNLKMALNGKKLYQLEGASYIQVLSSDFNQSNILLMNSQLKRLIVISYDLIDTFTYGYVVKIFYKNDKWRQLAVNSRFGTFNRKVLNQQVKIKISQNYQNILIEFYDEYTNKMFIKLLHVDYVTLQTKSIYFPQKIVQYGKQTYYHITNNFFYIRTYRLFFQTEKSVKYCYEMIYRINKDLQKLQTIRDQTLLQQDTYLWNKTFLYQKENDTIILVDYHSKVKLGDFDFPSVYFFFYKTRTIKGVSLIIKALKIMISTTGIFINQNQVNFCPSGCRVCPQGYGCLVCYNGFYLEKGECKQSVGNCKIINSLNTSLCSECYQGFWNGAQSCFKCHQSCLECVFSGIYYCSKCHYKYYLGSNRACLPCTQNCATCIDSITCLECITGYALNSQATCVKCPLDRFSCQSKGIYLWGSCIQGYGPDYQKNTSDCIKCPDNCLYCINSRCDTCYEGFQLNSQRNCSHECQFPCLDCNKNNYTECNQCFNGYILSNGKCLQDLNCNDIEGCVSCPMNYVLIYSHCYPCSSLVINCDSCSATNPSLCTQCHSGYYFVSTCGSAQCNQCPVGCLTCISEDICIMCQTGYVRQFIDIPSLCISCQQRCQECRGTPQNCLKCKDGFEMHGIICLSNINITYKLTLSTSFDQMKQNDFQKIHTSIISNFNKSKQQFHILKIYEGSVIIQGVIETSANQSQRQMIETLSSQYSSGSYINEIPIVSSEFLGSITYPVSLTSATQIDRTTLIIALAVSIPAFIIIVGLVIIGLCKKFENKINLQVDNQVSEQDTDYSMGSDKQQMQRAVNRTPAKLLKYLNKESKQRVTIHQR